MNRRGFLAGALVALVTVAGCAGAPAQPVGSTVVVGGARTGSAAPSWIPELDRALDRGMSSGETWTFVSTDGRPRVTGTVSLATTGANDLAVATERNALRDQVQRLLAVPAAAPEADPLTALSLAARVLRDQPAPHRIVVLDSLLQTAGPLRFADDGGALLGAAPDAVVEALASRGAQPSLDGVEVTLVGAGDTAPPQEAPAHPTRAALLALWTAVLHRSGATVRVVDTPLTGTPPPGLPGVTTVPIPSVAPVRVDRPTVVALPDALVGFLPDSAELRDPQATDAVLRPYSEALATGRVRAELTGTTSSAGDEPGRLELSRDRAATVAQLLVRSSGADPTLVSSRGVGTRFPGFRPDRDRSGALDPVRAAANRQVIVALFPH